MVKKILLSLLSGLLIFAASSGFAATYIAEPVLVTQPVYDGMSFYVYRPYNMPAGWFVTYDGYPVSRGNGGNWVYGVPRNDGTLVHTGYVVGSVVPFQQANLTPVVTVPANNGVMTSGAMPLTPRWLADDNFLTVTRWHRMVDRLAVLHKPKIPLAWKGDRPEVLYGWTGKSWYQMICKDGESPAETLKRHVYELTRMYKQNGSRWNDGDTAVLAAHAPAWGFLWVGRISPINL
ncbi:MULTISPECIES: hypothetical protein [Dethiosulfovibrio]|jgi:hypothetical protein|uniref:Uncharacterized protein n=2 Tax=Dethiosulfovibrio TaxID=47054 RepID=A0ABS9EPR0_9BACT|nr:MULTISPECIES: hypothetical protein [Dethiosulfovibrio]MCF4113405.1 hypothetical protein [Dethiosulfovibrio russensis]MCF4141875.1 hypothetical protein [Dethiosulfovibrio marinus]MCF4144029.1 hypothetical protein [Dethiosulfovibrio acidaminovorans]